jgi:hypothetical protein
MAEHPGSDRVAVDDEARECIQRKDVCFMRFKKVLLLLIFLTVAAGSCRDPHAPNIPSPPEEEKDGRDEPEDPGFAVPVSPPA